jgi:hypothetical protein
LNEKEEIFSDVQAPKNDFPDSIEEEKKLIEETKEIKAETEQKTRKKYTKKADRIAEESKAKNEFAQTTSLLGGMALGFVIDRYFPEQPLNEKETQLLNETTERVLFKYAEYLKNYQEEVALLAVLSFVLIPRFIDKKQTEKKEKEKTSEEKNPLDKT